MRTRELQGLTTAVLVGATALCGIGYAIAKWHSYLTLRDYVGRDGTTLHDLLAAGSLGTLAFAGSIATVAMMIVWTRRARASVPLVRAAWLEWVLLLGAWLVLAVTRDTAMDGTLGPVHTAVVGMTVSGVLLAAAAASFAGALRVERLSRV